MMNENLADFFDTDDGPAELILWGPAGSEVEIAAYFDAPHLAERDMSTGANRSYSFNLSSSTPYLTCMEEDVLTMQGGDRVVVNRTLVNGVLTGGVEYLVADFQPNGTGIAKIPLYKK